jgi:hypothetical protein
MKSISVFVFSLAGFGLVWLLIKWLAPGGAGQRRETERLARIGLLSSDEAARRVRPLLAEPTTFRVVESPVSDAASVLEGLAPELRVLFQRYETIELQRAPWVELSRTTIGPSARTRGLWRIGSVAEATDMTCEVAVRPGEEAIYEIHKDDDVKKAATHRSVYHFLLAAAEESE